MKTTFAESGESSADIFEQKHTPPHNDVPADDELALNVRRAFIFFHLTGSVLMYSASILSFSSEPGLSEAFIALYSFLFTTVIAAFEISRLYDMIHLEAMFADNFGFLYSPKIKANYIQV